MSRLPFIDPEDELICLGHGEDLAAQGGALAPPIVQTSLFAQPTLDDLVTGLSAEHRHRVYTRGNNPTVQAVEEKLARLERGAACRCFGSGMAAVSGVLLGLLGAGDHVLFVNHTYGPTMQLARALRRFGLEHDLIVDLDHETIERAILPNTRLVWMESPGTMTFRLVDVPGVVALARQREILTALDNSWASPLFQKPLAMGVDLSVHSATKYIGGHSDVVAGAVIGSEALMERIFYNAYLLNGGILAPFDAWLLNRGLRTLPVRMRKHHQDALEIAGFLDGHDAVRRVFHPGLHAAPGPLSGFSGLFSFELDSDDFEDVERFIDRLELFRIGVSWGGIESLVITPSRKKSRSKRYPKGLVRLSVGLEGAGVLIEDLSRALTP